MSLLVAASVLGPRLVASSNRGGYPPLLRTALALVRVRIRRGAGRLGGAAARLARLFALLLVAMVLVRLLGHRRACFGGWACFGGRTRFGCAALRKSRDRNRACEDSGSEYGKGALHNSWPPFA